MVVKTFDQFSGFKHNISKCEIAGIDALKRVPVTVCIMKSIELTTDFMKILGTCFSYNQNLKKEENLLRTISSIQSAFKLWKLKNLTFEGRIDIFKTLALSKTVSQLLINIIPNHIISELTSIQQIKYGKTMAKLKSKYKT